MYKLRPYCIFSVYLKVHICAGTSASQTVKISLFFRKKHTNLCRGRWSSLYSTLLAWNNPFVSCLASIDFQQYSYYNSFILILYSTPSHVPRSKITLWIYIPPFTVKIWKLVTVSVFWSRLCTMYKPLKLRSEKQISKTVMEWNKWTCK